MTRKILKSYKHKDSGYRIRRLEDRKDGLQAWQVDCGRKSGKLLRKTFESKSAAEIWAVAKKQEAKEVGNAAFSHSDKLREDVKQALHMLEPFDCTLRKAVQFYVDRHKPVDRKADTSHMIDLYWEHQQQRLEKGIIRERTYKETISQLSGFKKAFAGRNINTIEGRDIEAWLDTTATGRTARENYRRYVSMLFSFCIKQGRADNNPTPKQDEAERIKRKKTHEPSIYTADEARRVMQAAENFAKGTESRMYIVDGEKQHKDRRCIVSYLALNLFAGVRPTELTRLDWQDVALKKTTGSIYISPDVSKTGDDRRISIEPNLLSWLKQYKHTGRVFPYSSSVLRAWRRQVFEDAGVTHQQDAGRHAYASHHLSKHNSITKLRINMGHTEGSGVLFQHYVSLAEHIQEDASAYFSTKPNDKSKIVRLKVG